jgi:hypothetical protein
MKFKSKSEIEIEIENINLKPRKEYEPLFIQAK